MISIICVYNNEQTLRNVLLKSLENQTVQFELITLNNSDNRYKSAAEALNYGGTKAKGDFIMFVHQDMWLGNNSWLEDAEKVLKTIPELGVAGVAGASEKGSNWKERCKHSITVFDEGWDIAPVEGFEEIQTLDECLLIVPRPVFRKLKFDEKVFDGWDCYGADYCLAVRQLGLKGYVIPGDCSHCCIRRKMRPWEFRGLLKYQKKLYKKYKHDYKTIYSYMGKLTWLTLRFRETLGLVGNPFIRLFPDFYSILSNELSGCDTVLDLGCGHLSPIHALNIPFSVGVELSDLYLQESKRHYIHSQYLLADIRTIGFKQKAFDAVIALDVLEYLTKQEGAELLTKMEKWARKKVVIKTPNISFKYGIVNINPMKEYKSVWEAEEFKELGFKIRGIGGWKGLERKYKYLRELLLNLTQKIVFHFPRQAAGLLVSKRTDIV